MFVPRCFSAPLLICVLTCPLGACEDPNPSELMDAMPSDDGSAQPSDAETDAAIDDAMDAATDAETDAATDADARVEEDAAPVMCDVTAPRVCPDPAPSYADVEPIFEMHCISCHDGLGENWALTSYDHVADWYDTIRAMMLTCGMPPLDAGTSMPTTEERELILTWIRCGYPE
jgi:hypothetical protein